IRSAPPRVASMLPPDVSSTAPTALASTPIKVQSGLPLPRSDVVPSRPNPQLPRLASSDPAFVAPDAPAISPERGDHETAIQTPLAWPPTSRPNRRWHLLIAGILLGAVGIFA